MKIFITGATGFIGQHLIKLLLKEGYTIHILVRPSTDSNLINSQVRVFVYNSSIESLLAYFKNENFQGVIHLASLFSTQHKTVEIEPFISSNITLGTQLLEAATLNNVAWFINTGTFWQNYNDKNNNPLNLYAATKEAFETIAKYFTLNHPLKFVTLKLNDTFGSNDTRDKILNLWKKNLQTKELLEMSKGDQIIDISYIDDITNAYLVLIDYVNKTDFNICKNKVFVVSNSQKISLKALSKLFEKLTQTTLNIQWGAKEYRKNEIFIPYSSGKTVPNWKQKYTLEESLKKWIADND